MELKLLKIGAEDPLLFEVEDTEAEEVMEWISARKERS